MLTYNVVIEEVGTGKPSAITPIQVQNGAWVALVTIFSVITGVGAGAEKKELIHRVIGADGSVKEYTLQRRRVANNGRVAVYRHLLIVDQKPFGVIIERTGADNLWGKRLVTAQEVRGEVLRLRMLFTMPNIVYEPADKHGTRCGWVRLSHLTAVARMDPQDLLHTFLPFTHLERPRLRVIVSAGSEPLRTTRLRRHLYYAADVTRLKEHRAETVWVTRGFAKTVLTLVHFGYQPPTTLASAGAG